MIGPRIPTAKRLVNSIAPLNPADMSEANANNIMFLLDLLATAEYIQDAAVLQRHLSQLMGREQNSPNLTVRVEPGTAWFGLNSYVTFAGGNSPAIAAPSVNPRRDVVTIRNDGNLYVLPGVEAVSPVAPAIPSTDVAICQVYCVVGMTRIRDNDTQEVGQGYIEYDLRPLFSRPLGADAMPRLGLVARVQPTLAGNAAYQTILSYSGSGRLRGAHFFVGAASTYNVKVTVDSIVQTIAISGGTGTNWDLYEAISNSINSLKLVTGTADPATNLNIYFKNTLKVEIQNASGTDGTTSTVNYEHE